MYLMEYILKFGNNKMKQHYLLSIKLKNNKVYFVVDKCKFKKLDILYWNRIIDNIHHNWDVSICILQEFNKLCVYDYEDFNLNKCY